ncbi:hypothetical protein GQ53DRAFT_448985 [Thozetella sp. PMI_491]|nr:hypothetical protein GQ53DRAFT_448985 [Thozetella sp. PMI_491]
MSTTNRRLQSDDGRPRRACNFCTRRKIRCSKEVPKCLACKVRNRGCRYDSQLRDLPDSPDSQTNHGNVDRTLPTAPDVVWPPSFLPKANLRGAAIRFMDRSLFLRSQAQAGTITFTEPDPIPSHLGPFLSNRDALRQIAISYYRLANRWLPIISKKKIFDQLLNPLLPLRADAVFLLLCMKTALTQPLSEPHSWPSEYHAAVRYRTDLELAGLASLEILQGCILLAAYEQGNAIYPAAHTSIGICLQHASALRMGWTYSIASHIDAEERNRSWWAIFLLERVLGLGDAHQMFVVPEPNLDAQLPWPDQDWEDYTVPSTSSTLSSPPIVVGSFASILQASFVLSRVFGYLSAALTEVQARLDEVEQFERTLQALMSYARPAPGADARSVCYQKAVGYAALIALHVPHLQLDHGCPLHQRACIALDDAVHSASEAAELYLSKVAVDSEPGDTSPFIVPWLYMAGTRAIRSGLNDDLGVIENALTKLNSRWKAAGIYMELLAASKAMEPA